MEPQGFETHLASGEFREINVDGKTLIVYSCRRCGRKFGREAGAKEWRAAHIGAFTVEFLDDSLSRKWVSEPCPGQCER
jgi:hypothetical protein